MLAIRSLLFNILFYLLLITLMIIGLPSFLFGRLAVFEVAKFWSKSSLWLLKVICGQRVEFRGVEKLPTGGYLIASKHQSMLETFALINQVTDFSFVLKKELTRIPLFGWYLSGCKQIAIDRSTGRSALEQTVEQSSRALAEGRQIIIFPEGTRRAPGAPPLYKSGASYIYAATGAPCVPVALNTGLFWGRRSFLRRPGLVVIEFLDVIPPGLHRAEFLALLKERIETATDRLMADALAQDPSLAAVLAEAPDED